MAEYTIPTEQPNFTVMLSVIMPSDVMLSASILNVVLLCIFRQSVINQSANMVIVVASYFNLYQQGSSLSKLISRLALLN